VNLLDQLRAARELISVDERWTTGAMARDEGGQSVSPISPYACCWCGVGALYKVEGAIPADCDEHDGYLALYRAKRSTGLAVSALLHVTDAAVESDAAPGLVVHALWGVAQQSVLVAHAIGLLLPDGSEARFTDSDDLAEELTTWARNSVELWRMCDQRWALEVETMALDGAREEVGDRHVA